MQAHPSPNVWKNDFSPYLPARTRHGYQTQLFERSHRRRDELDGAIGEMFVGGVSMAKVGHVVETLTGSTPSASTVSRVFHSLESEYAEWKQRKLAPRYAYAFADGTYFTVIYNGEGCKMPILAVIGIAETGERDVLAFRVGDRENEQACTPSDGKTGLDKPAGSPESTQIDAFGYCGIFAPAR